jgi:hypothetical protein
VTGYICGSRVREPNLEGGYDARPAPITCILRALLESDFRSVSAVDACATTPTVFMSGGERMVAMPLPVFWQAAKNPRGWGHQVGISKPAHELTQGVAEQRLPPRAPSR